MQSRIFGRTQHAVSEIGHGTWTMGAHWGPRDDRAAIDSLVCSLECGVTFIDTAWVYGDGHSESLIASAFREAKKKVFVASKVPPKNHKWPARHDESIEDYFPKNHIIEYTEKSLKNLRTDCLELQQLHVWSDNWLDENSDWFKAIEQLKSQGKIKYFGVSINDHQPDFALKIVESGLIDSVQVIYNIFDQAPEKKLFPACLKNKVAVIARVPFDEGSLTGTLKPDTIFHKKDWRHLYFTKERLPEVCNHVEPLKKIAENLKMTLPQLALKFILSHPAVSTVIPGMRTINHVQENCRVSNDKTLDKSVIDELKKHAWERNFYPVWN